MKFTDEAPKIDTATYIKPGVTREALGDLAKNIMTTGETIYTNYQVGSLRDDINKQVQSYETSQKDYETGMQAGQVAGGQEMAIDALWEGANVSGVDTQTTAGAITSLEREYSANLQKFQAARTQGKISEEELVARINKTTREFVNRNPWMEQELYAAAQTHLKNTGVADILKYRQDLEKDRLKDVKDEYQTVYKHLLSRNVPGTRPGMPMDEMLTNLLFDQKQQYVADRWKNWSTTRTGMSQAQVDAMLPSLYNEGIYTIVNDKNRTWATDLSQITDPSKVAAYQVQMQQDAANEVMLMRQRLAKEGVLHTDEAKEAVASFEKDLNNSIKSLVGVASGKDAAEILKNRADYQATAQKIGVMNQINVAAVDTFKDIAPLLPESVKMRLMNNFGLDKTVGGALQMLDQSFAATPGVQEMVKSGNAATLFGGILEAGTKNPNNPRIFEATKMMVNNLNVAYKAGKMEPTEVHNSVNQTLGHIVRNEKFFATQTPDPGLISQLKPQIDFHMETYAPGLFKAAEGIMKDNPGTEIVFDVTPSGGLVVYSNDPSVTQDLNTRMVSEINNALSSWAIVNGVSREKAAPEFYKQYFSGILANDPDIGGSGTNPTKPANKGVVTAPVAPTTPLQSKPLAKGETQKMRNATTEYQARQEERNRVSEQILAAEKKDLENQLKADKVALRVAKERNAPEDVSYRNDLEKRIKDAETKLSGKGGEWR